MSDELKLKTAVFNAWIEWLKEVRHADLPEDFPFSAKDLELFAGTGGYYMLALEDEGYTVVFAARVWVLSGDDPELDSLVVIEDDGDKPEVILPRE